MKKVGVALLFLVVGIGVGIFGWLQLGKARASLSWPTADGVIMQSDVRRERRWVKTGKHRREKITYKADVDYIYTVNGQEYSADRISYGGTHSSSSRVTADQITSQYPRGKKVTVSYDPQDPGEAVLEPGVSIGVYGTLAAGVLIALVGVAAVIMGFCGKEIPVRLTGTRTRSGLDADVDLT